MDNLWILFSYQPQSDILVFLIITFYIHNILVLKLKHGIGPNYIITFHEELEFLSASIIELVNINESLHEEDIVIFITNKNLNMTGNNYVT